MKKHRSIPRVLALCLACACSVLALAACSRAPVAQSTDSASAGTVRQEMQGFEGIFSNEYQYYKMNLAGDYRYWGMTITNSGSDDLQVNVDDTVYRISANSTEYIYSTNRWGAGNYEIGFSSKNLGHSMEGSVVCTLYATLEEAEP